MGGGPRRVPRDHHRHGQLSRERQQRLIALDALIPPMSEGELRIAARKRNARIERSVVVLAVVTVVVLAAALVGVQWIRPLPSPVFRPAGPTAIRLPGPSPSLPWPTTGAAALSVEGVGDLGQVRATVPAPVAGVATVLAAYVALTDHPLASGAAGPAVPVSPATYAAYLTGFANQQSEVAVAPGETLPELQVLEGLLVASGNDMATMLADWDAGGTDAFVAKMNGAAQTLALHSTHITDPSGLDSGTVSTPSDLIRLGEAAMAIPTFRQVVAMPQVTLPLAGLVYNLDYDVGHDGLVGIKTGSDAMAEGCFLFAAQRTIGGRNVTLIGAVLGQQGMSSNSAAVDEADVLVTAGFASIRPTPVAPAGHLVGRIVTPWGSTAPVAASTSPNIIGWPGLSVPVSVSLDSMPLPLPNGARVGVLRVDEGGHVTVVVLRTERPLPGPSALWRLTRS